MTEWNPAKQLPREKPYRGESPILRDWPRRQIETDGDAKRAKPPRSSPEDGGKAEVEGD